MATQRYSQEQTILKLIKISNKYKEKHGDLPTRPYLVSKMPYSRAWIYYILRANNLHDIYKKASNHDKFKKNTKEYLEVYVNAEKITLKAELLKMQKGITKGQAYQEVFNQYKFFSGIDFDSAYIFFRKLIRENYIKKNKINV